MSDNQIPPPGLRRNPLDGGFKYSASQIGTQRDCFTKWYLDQTLGLPREDTSATALGKKVHSELEGWLKKGEPPSNPRAKALLSLLPLPSHNLLVEHEFRLLTPPGVVRGFIDVFVPDVSEVKMPEDWPSDGTPAVLDHKTTANLFYAKTATDLLTDPQGVLYGMAARVFVKEKTGEIPENVDLNWNYVQTRGSAETKRVRARQSLQTMEDGLGPILEEAASMRAALVTDVKAEDLPHNLKACEKYGGCQFMDYCPHFNRKVFSMAEETEPVESATLARLRKAREAARANTESKPAAPAPPPAVEKPVLTAVQPTVTPEPSLEPIPTDKVAASSTSVEVLPPDAPAPKTRKTKPAAPAGSISKDELDDALSQIEKAARVVARFAIDQDFEPGAVVFNYATTLISVTKHARNAK